MLSGLTGEKSFKEKLGKHKKGAIARVFRLLLKEFKVISDSAAWMCYKRHELKKPNKLEIWWMNFQGSCQV